MDGGLTRRIFSIRSVPPTVVALTALVSYIGQLSAILQGWPLWAIGLATLLPWIPLFSAEMVWTYRHYGWLALFYILVITQSGHVVEHIAQMVQIHVLGLKGAGARGIFGQLDIEWVHYIWNSWVLIAVLLLLTRFRRNPWLWVTLGLAGWHELEHIFIMSRFLLTGKAGAPELLAMGGAIFGGLPLTRPDLHFLYNVIETIPLVLAFVYQLRRSYNEWLKRAFPQMTEQMLVETTNRLQTMRFPAGAKVITQGDVPDRFYILTKGETLVTQRNEAGEEKALATLVPGQYFGEIGLLSLAPRTATVTAKTPVEVLALDRDAFQALVSGSEAAHEELIAEVRRRMAGAVEGV